jgi:hypothetical protein
LSIDNHADCAIIPGDENQIAPDIVNAKSAHNSIWKFNDEEVYNAQIPLYFVTVVC